MFGYALVIFPNLSNSIKISKVPSLFIFVYLKGGVEKSFPATQSVLICNELRTRVQRTDEVNVS